MRRVLLVLLTGAMLCATVGAEDLLQNDDGHYSLNRWKCFSAETLTDVSDVWTIDQEGVLSCAGLPRGYLYTEKAYTDFVLTLQWRWPPESEPGKGGVLCRMTGELKIWPKCLEAQINQGGEGDLIGLVGYELSGPSDRLSTMDHEQFGKLTFLKRMKAVAKPAGQWNDYEIRVKGQTATLRLNGQVVNEATGCDVVAGPILLTSENDKIQFRNIQLTSMDK